MTRREQQPSARRHQGAWGLTARVLAVAVGVLATTPSRADVLDEAWKRGNDAYLRGDYPAAIAAYEQIDRQQVVSPELTFNLGDAYYRRGELGRAIWSWERTLALDPEHDDARYNLAQARKVVATRVNDKLEGADRDPAWMRLVGQLSQAASHLVECASRAVRVVCGIGWPLHQTIDLSGMLTQGRPALQ